MRQATEIMKRTHIKHFFLPSPNKVKTFISVEDNVTHFVLMIHVINLENNIFSIMAVVMMDEKNIRDDYFFGFESSVGYAYYVQWFSK